MKESILKGKNAVVTGGTKGIGAAIAERLASEGVNLAVVSRTPRDCENMADKLAGEYGVMAVPLPMDLSITGNAGKLAYHSEQALGSIDILINNAGIGITKNAEEITEEEWDKVININLKGSFFLAQEVGKVMIRQGGGTIVNVASALGLVALKGVLPYCVSKAGVIQMTKALAVEWAKKGIKVNALCPGYVITDINKEQLTNEGVADKLLSRMPVGRFATVDEMAEGAVFLAASTYMTGQCLVLDGGWTAQ